MKFYKWKGAGTMKNEEIEKLKKWELEWALEGITRPYSAEDVIRLRGSIDIEQYLRVVVLRSFWTSLHTEDYLRLGSH